MNTGVFINTVTAMYDIATEYCGDDWKIEIFTFASGLGVTISWCRNIDNEYIKHYCIGIAPEDDMAYSLERMAALRKFFREQYEEEVIPIG